MTGTTEKTSAAISRTASCGVCVFYQEVAVREPDGYQNEGICRRNAPVAVACAEIQDNGKDMSGVLGALVAWPRVFSESDWCGQFRSRADVAGALQIERAPLA